MVLLVQGPSVATGPCWDSNPSSGPTGTASLIIVTIVDYTGTTIEHRPGAS